jgi:hypothetical protein
MPKEKIENIDIKRGITQAVFSCKDCYFLKNAGAYRDDKGNLRPCEYFGTIAQSEPCRLFVPNPRNMHVAIGPALEILSKLSNPQVAIAAFLSSKRIRATNFKIGQKVYFHVLGLDYLNNYASGHIIGYVQNKLIIEGLEGHISQILPESAYNEQNWSAKLASLLKDNRINDKTGLHKIYNGMSCQLHGYSPPMLSAKKKKYKKIVKEKLKEKMPKVINLR